ncbi:MAG: hypothetical protein MUF71_04360 [Candidatus Kapabacteria bacterium]|nr:hypothetical protein [Candidatus Kapabacteria bacterium]
MFITCASALYSQQSASTRGLRCSDALTFCQTTLRTNFPTDSTFLQEPLPAAACLASVVSNTGEQRVNGVWYRITAYQSGDLGFGIQPVNADGTPNTRVNLDWALFRLTDSTTCGRLGEPVRCNTAPRGGLTGAIESEFSEEPFSEPIRNVRSGETFLLLVLNPSNYVLGYTIDMGFSSSQTIAVQSPLSLRNLTSPRNVCQTNTLTVEISDRVLVNTVTSGVFTVQSARGVRRNVTQVTSQRFGITTTASASALDNQFTLFLDRPIEQSERYTVRTQQVLPSVCQTLGTLAQVSALISVGPQVDIVGFREYCAVGAKISASAEFRSYFWENARTGASVGNTRTITVPEGEYRLTVIDNNGCQASTSAFIRTTTAIVLGLSTVNGRTSFCNYGDGSDGVMLEATPGFDRYEWFFNGTPMTGIPTTGTTSQKYVFDSPGLYSVRAFVNGCESVSNSVRISMRPVPVKPSIRRVGNYLTVANPAFPGANYYWIQRLPNGDSKGIENGWDCSPVTSGTYFVRLTNDNQCSFDSDSLVINLAPVRVRMETGSYTSFQGRPFDVQFRMTTLAGNPQMVGATSITLTLRCFAGLLLPMSGQRNIIAQREDNNRNRFITLNFPLPTQAQASNNAVIGTLRMVAGIPSGMLSGTNSSVRATTATGLFLENIAFLTPNGKTIQGIRTDTTLGTFRLQNAGFTAFTGNADLNIAQTSDNEAKSDEKNTSDTSISMTLHPNPASNGLLTVDYLLSAANNAEERVSAYLQDALGNRIKTLFADERRGSGLYSRECDISDVPRGTYLLIVRTATTYRTAIFSINR